jgi:PhnB protein
MYAPEGFGTVFPYIFASDAAAYLRFLERAFGAEVVGRTDAPDGTVANARVRIGTTAFMVSEAGGRFEPGRAAFYLYVEDADRTHREALACGADDIHAPRDMDYGDRQGGVIDPSGNTWWISTRLAHEPYD